MDIPGNEQKDGLLNIGPTDNMGRDNADPASTTRSVTDDITGATVTTEAPIHSRDKDFTDAPVIGANFRSIVMGSRNRRPLSPEAQTYLQTMRDELKKSKMSVIDMPNDGVYIATNGRDCVGLIFNEAMRAPSVDDEYVPACVHIGRIIDDTLFLNKLEELKINRPCEMIVIPRTDYIDTDAGAGVVATVNRAVEKGSVAANAIRTVTDLAINAEFNIDDMARFPIRLVTNPAEVAKHVADISPSGVLPWYQYGVACEICMDPRVLDSQTRVRSFDRDSYDWELLFVLGGATEFLDSREAGDRRFVPMVTMTVCESTVKSLKMLPFMLAVAEEVFIQQGTYLDYFRNWGEDNPNPNLGRLVIDDADGRLAAPLRTQREWEEFVRRAIDNPFLAADVRVGAWNHPALECLLNPASGIELLTEELQQLDPQAHIDLSNIVRDQVDFYCGNIIDNGQTVDTRSFDYFKILQTQQDPMILDQFMGYTDNPEDRLKAIAACGWKTTTQALGRGIKTIESLYDCNRMIFDANTVCDMIELSANLNIIRNLKQSSNYAFDFHILRDLGRTFNQRERSILRGGQRNYNSFNTGSYLRNLWDRRSR